MEFSLFFLFPFQYSMIQIRLDSSNIFMPNLKIVPAQMSGTSSSSAAPSPLSSSQSHDHHHQQHHHKIYQLCACSNGKLFLAMSHSICAGDVTTVCSWFYAIQKNVHYISSKSGKFIQNYIRNGHHLMEPNSINMLSLCGRWTNARTIQCSA